MVFAFIGSLDLRPVVSPASGRGLASYLMRELALQSRFRHRLPQLRVIYLGIDGLRPFPISI